MAKKNSLGRGLDALFLENDEDDSNRLSVIRTADIEPNPSQPRRTFDADALAQLADSIAQHGLLQPIAVRESLGGFYQIIAGERRWRAAKMAGLLEIPAIIYEMDDKKAAELALIENLQREDLNPIEEALAFRTLITEFGLTQEDTAQQIGKSRSAVANTLRLLDLPEAVVDMVASNRISAGHARAIMSLHREQDMLPFAERIIEKELSVREAEAAAKFLNEEAAQKEAESDSKAPVSRETAMAESYLRSLERRASAALGTRFRILDSGRGKQKKIEITYSGNEDLEALLRRLCGDDFFENT